jgi:hypothetical protein
MMPSWASGRISVRRERDRTASTRGTVSRLERSITTLEPELGLGGGFARNSISIHGFVGTPVLIDGTGPFSAVDKRHNLSLVTPRDDCPQWW